MFLPIIMLATLTVSQAKYLLIKDSRVVNLNLTQNSSLEIIAMAVRSKIPIGTYELLLVNGNNTNDVRTLCYVDKISDEEFLLLVSDCRSEKIGPKTSFGIVLQRKMFFGRLTKRSVDTEDISYVIRVF